MRKLIPILLITIISFYFIPAYAGSDGNTELTVKNSTSSNDVKDCFEKINRGIFAFNQGLDKIVFKPLAIGYRTLPGPFRSATSNVLSNISNVITVPNNLLQGQIKNASLNSEIKLHPETIKQIQNNRYIYP